MTLGAFNWIDYTILAVVVFSTLISFARGFVREAISLISWAAAIFIAYKYSYDFGEHFLAMLTSEQARTLSAAAILFFVMLIVGAIVNYAISNLVYMTGLSIIDRTLGMAFGCARGVLLVAVFILVGQIMQLDKKPWWIESQLIPQFSPMGEWLKSFVPEQFEKLKSMAVGMETEKAHQEATASALKKEITKTLVPGVMGMPMEVTPEKMAAPEPIKAAQPVPTPVVQPESGVRYY